MHLLKSTPRVVMKQMIQYQSPVLTWIEPWQLEFVFDLHSLHSLKVVCNDRISPIYAGDDSDTTDGSVGGGGILLWHQLEAD